MAGRSAVSASRPGTPTPWSCQRRPGAWRQDRGRDLASGSLTRSAGWSASLDDAGEVRKFDSPAVRAWLRQVGARIVHTMRAPMVTAWPLAARVPARVRAAGRPARPRTEAPATAGVQVVGVCAMCNRTGQGGWGCLWCVAERTTNTPNTCDIDCPYASRTGCMDRLRQPLSSSRSIQRPSTNNFGTGGLGPIGLFTEI